MKNILITGAAGFIGSHLCDYFISKNFNVIGLDNLITGSVHNLKHLEKNVNFTFIKHDIRNKINLNFDVNQILHFASPASPSHYLKYPIFTLQTGSTGTENILNLAIEKNAKILVASTSEIYGDPLEHPQSESYFGNVNTVGPRSVYDEAKRYLESITNAYKNNKNLDVRIARIFNTYGPRMLVEDGRAIPNFINQAINNEEITIYGDGSQTRSFCYIDDTIFGIYSLLNSEYNCPVNIGNSNEYSIIDVANKIIELTNSKSKIKYFELPENDPKVRKPNIDLIKNISNWEPKINLQDGLKKTIDYFYSLK